MNIQVKGKNIFFKKQKRKGANHTILFIHGAVMDCSRMRLFFHYFKNCNCIAVDLPCHGGSEGPKLSTIEEYADFIADFLDSLSEKKLLDGPVIIAGYSMGGCIALELAIRQFKQISGIIILDSGADLAGNLPLLTAMADVKPEDIDFEAFFSMCFGTISTQRFKKIMLNALMSTKASNDVCYSDLATSGIFSKLEECKNISVPVLVIQGDEDQIIPLSCALNLRNTIPNCSLTVLPFVGHSGIFEYISFTTEAMKNFISHKIDNWKEDI